MALVGSPCPARTGGLDFARRLLGDECGATVLMLALVTPVLFGAVGVAVDYGVWFRQTQMLQKAADTGALAAASDLATAPASQDRIDAVVNSVVEAALGAERDSELTVEASAHDGGRGVRVLLRQPRRALLSHIFTPGSGTLEATALATRSEGRKICVLALDPEKSGAIMLDASSRLSGVDCLVQSNSRDPKGFASKSAALVTAPLMCSAGGYEGGPGNFSGDRVADCPKRADPLAGRPAPPIGGCSSASKLVITSDGTLFPGVYCEGIEIKAGARVTLNPGVYVMRDGPLRVDDNSRLYGRDVGIYFTGTNANFDFLSTSTVDLTARKEGDLAGILFFGDRNAPETREYKITSDNARNLVGTIYLPRGYLTVDARNPVADRSAYTAIVAQRIELLQSPHLVLNTNYGATDVPVPDGIGPNASVRLVQ